MLIVLFVTTLFIITSLLSALTNIGPARHQLQLWGLWPLSFAPGQPGETLIVIVPFFRSAGVMDSDAAHNIAERVRDGVDKIKLLNVRVEVLEEQQLRADDRSGAEALGKRTNASMIIWGADTGTKVEVKYLNLRQPEFDAAEITLQEQGGKGRTQVANPQPYAEFVTDDLPQVMSFLSLFALGQAAYIQKDYKQAAQIIEQGLVDVQRAPQDTEGQADANFRLGWLRDELGEKQKALVAYNQAIALNPQYATAYNNRGALRNKQGDLAGARIDYDLAIALDPQDAKAYYNRGTLHKEQGDMAGARTDLDQAIALDPRIAAAYINRGILRIGQGDPAGGRTDYDQAIAINPQYVDAYYNRGILRQEQGDTAGARADYDQAIALDPQAANVHNSRGVLRKKQGDTAGARTDYDQAIALNPRYAEAYYNRGILRSEKDEVGALADYNQAIALNPRYAEAYYNRGVLHYNQGNGAHARADFLNARDLATGTTLRQAAETALQAPEAK